MNITGFIDRQIIQIRQGGHKVLARKITIALPILFNSIWALPIVLLIRLIRPIFLVRFGGLISSRIGHFAANTELFLCERDANINKPNQCFVDLFYFASLPVCNQQLAVMWKRVLTVWPACLLKPVVYVNGLIPGGSVHVIDISTQQVRDFYNLVDRYPSHLNFTDEEETRGALLLEGMGIPPGVDFVCLNVRDDAYLKVHQTGFDWSYHSYRDSDIQNYILAVEALADLGYFVIRMGAKVNEGINSIHPRVIDYAVNGMRSDFMDIYLGSKCLFCISTGTGWDNIPYIFRRPIALVNFVPLAGILKDYKNFISITKHYFDKQTKKELSLCDIINKGALLYSYSNEYESNGLQLRENSPEEIRDVVIEMLERLIGTWKPHEDDEALQKRFWVILSEALKALFSRSLDGERLARYGALFLRNNREWLL